MAISSPVGLLRTRLGLKLVLTVFASIVIVEAVVLVPSYRNYETDLLTRLALIGRATMVSAYQSRLDDHGRFTVDPGALQRSEVRGSAVYAANGELIASSGEAPALQPPASFSTLQQRFHRERKRLDVAWPPSDTGLPVTIVARIDTGSIAGELSAFVWRIIGLVLLISLVVCGATMTVFHRLVLKRILSVRSQLEAASVEIDRSAVYQLEIDNHDELGEVIESVNGMLCRVSEVMQGLERARLDLARANDELERRVDERTEDLVSANDTLKDEISERQRIEERLRFDAFHDRLTRLANRELLLDRVGHAIEGSRRHTQGLFALALVNVDRFKVVNDSIGHLGGDEALCIIANRFKEIVRPSDTVARLGGDDFGILLTDLTSPADAMPWAQRIQQGLGEPLVVEAQEFFRSVSIGMTVSDMGYVRAESMLQDAATALAHAKQSGRARCRLFNARMRDAKAPSLKLESDLRRAVTSQNQLRLHYQPVVELASGKILGFESLVRWQHPLRGLVGPAEFISLAEETGLVVPMGDWIMNTAIGQLRRWQIEPTVDADLFMSINISAQQIVDGELVEALNECMVEHQVRAETVKLEVTESLLMRNPRKAGLVLEELKDLNVQLCIDDFGTGYSSLSYLRQFPFDVLKIDRSFVRAMTESQTSREIVGTIVELAHVLDKTVVAEGAENEQEVTMLRELGCEACQGYFFSAPLDASAAGQLLDRASFPACVEPRALAADAAPPIAKAG